MGTFQTEILVKSHKPPEKTNTCETWTKKSIDAKNHRYNTKHNCQARFPANSFISISKGEFPD